MSRIEQRRAAHSATLQPGEWFAGKAPYRIATLLGSCVSITLWNRARRVGAMSHILLPSRGAVVPHDARDPRFCDEALALMAEALARLNVDIAQCEAKLFGGGNMFPRQFADDDAVGRQNGETARRLLQARGVRVVSESLYGVGHRRIVFDVSTGIVWMQRPGEPNTGRLGKAAA